MNLLTILTISLIIFLNGKYCETNSTDVKIPFDRYFHNESILPFNTWGTFRGLTYFGLKTSSPNSPAFGLIWFSNNANNASALHLRHWCSQSDNLRYFWKSHNFNDFGVQQIVDNNYTLNTSFIKFSKSSWKSLITSELKANLTNDRNEYLSVVLYFAKERPTDTIKVFHSDKNSFIINGNIEYIGNFRLNIKIKSNDTLYSGYLDTQSTLVNAVKTLKSNLKPMSLKDTKVFVIDSSGTHSNSSFIAFQVVFHKKTEIEIDFQPENQTIDGNNYENELIKREKIFDQEFETIFKLTTKGFNHREIDFAKATLSEMLGSIGYFYGNQSVGSVGMKSGVAYGPLQILSAVPSRPVFPRPFLWDEGFHNLLISRWNSSLTLKIIKSWLNIMNIEGWIPREISLNDEMYAVLNPHYWTQHDFEANPPSFLMAIESMVTRNKIDSNYLKGIFPRLEAWFQWFNTTQNGFLLSTYRWRGRNSDSDNSELNPGTLNSGLDDYPRSTHPTDDEYHLDLRCWLAYMSRVMTNISSIVGDHKSEERYSETAKQLADNSLLDKLHWSEAHKMYCDYGYHSTNVSLIPNPDGKGLIRKVWTQPKYQFVCELGYVSLSPLLFNILEPNNPKLNNILDSIENSTQLWTPFGLRSISKTSLYYNKFNREGAAPYWRGPIWVNLNYLTLKGLKYYSQIQGPNQKRCQKIYTELRNNLIKNMFKEYERSGFVWEQYNDMSGVGQRSHPFVGWSGVIVLIMSEDY